MDIRPEPNSMTGAELVEFAQEYKRILRYRPELGGANEAGVCQVCNRPFLYNTNVRPPETCGRDSCMKPMRTRNWGVPETKPKTDKPRRTRKPSSMVPLDDQPTPPPVIQTTSEPVPEPYCWCSCHAVAYLEAWGLLPEDIEWVQQCEHCRNPFMGYA